jgi:hypothetical protein
VKVFFKILFSISLFLIIASYGLPIIFDLFLVLIIILIIRFNIFNLIFINFLILILTLFINPILIKDYKKKAHFYRAHEKFIVEKGIYKKNIDSQMIMAHGDIVALDVCNNKDEVKEKRLQKFITDENGFRNDNVKINEAEIILVGDSFIAGSSNTQENTPANILSQFSKKKVYSITVISEPEDYELYLSHYIDKLKPGVEILLFYFAGNDFRYKFKNHKNLNFNNFNIDYLKFKIRFGYERLEKNKDKIFIKTLKSLYDKNYFYQKIRPQSQRFFKKILAQWTNSCDVKYYEINGNLVGFAYLPVKNYHSVSTHIIRNKKILNKIKKVFYIPTKYSVYNEFIANEVLNNDAYNYLKESYKSDNIEIIDLTKFLQKEAKKNLKKNDFIYWKDDTHWNEKGISLVMRYISRTWYD